MSDQPRVIVLGGCNGAGKTTASRALLADTLGVLTFVNADVIAQGLAGFDVENALIAAGRLTLTRLRELSEQRESFAVESTLSGKAYVAFLRKLKQAGYRIEIYYFWLASVELSIQRVAARVARGGHNVPEDVLRQRYPRSLKNFWELYRPLADKWKLYENSESYSATLVASGSCEEVFETHDDIRLTKFLGSMSHE